MLFGLGPCLFLLGLPFAYSYPCACVLTDGVYLKSSEIYKPLTVGKCYRYSQDTTKPLLKIQDYKVRISIKGYQVSDGVDLEPGETVFTKIIHC